ncbi:6-phosphogluconate dehydrogenase C-terminal domain-like protein [Hortaea werneckii]|uniref:2-dehydropantoate 2-reductase n=1 Tax=Hortaea werneckii TaxID=91943 RepID=A0A3M7J8N6_HORWE|nr:6-phosphogluconate dehydrogenase C-terminal domain-like protein [Hortaea werneckii]KAI6945210.1 6-phosphogluconate dehydrogenase C-terminal domain-like protein [Hortaea werneckii]KAI6951235.1 6-phosphogluconate dehydrogenase C-terminal domain-like protein [Hortaea werneckii]KAI7000058.1 6-phosphogluconate dehydrogenase C-terminal domain-like protein [Hortaea werneckii]KAI7051428.1 6-phosphogluconate dehydrogenase C-terminal domain-like protein [Hortaea werneckii]
MTGRRRVHIIGLGSIGLLVAHSLRNMQDPPPVSLIFHRLELLQQWQRHGQQITVQDGRQLSSKEGFEVELTPAAHQSGDTLTPLPISEEPIDCLLVCTKAAVTVAALKRLRPRLSPESCICFLQNGMGTIEDVNMQCFSDEGNRPQYLQGVITHGTHLSRSGPDGNPFLVTHAGHGSISLGVPSNGAVTGHGNSPYRNSSSIYISDVLREARNLGVVCISSEELLQQLLEKLAVNCVINPLTALLDIPNGTINTHGGLVQLMRSMIKEVSSVFLSLQELSHVSNLEHRFSADRLEQQCHKVIQTTSKNISSMLADVRGAKPTEIDYINGYVVRRGKELGIVCKTNEAMVHLMAAKAFVANHTM